MQRQILREQHPVANPRILNVHEFRADRIRVNFCQARNHFAQRHLLAVGKKFRSDAKIEVLLAKTELAQRQQPILRSFFREWIYAGDCMTERAISVNQTVDPRL